MPAWQGFRSVRVSRKSRESASVTSLALEPTDGLPLTAALPGQFVVLRLGLARGAPALMRSYSLSGQPSDRRYRISVKREPHGVASAYIDEDVRIGDLLEISAPRGGFTLRPGDGPVVLLSAGVGATPVLAMLHALAAESSRRCQRRRNFRPAWRSKSRPVAGRMRRHEKGPHGAPFHAGGENFFPAYVGVISPV